MHRIAAWRARILRKQNSGAFCGVRSVGRFLFADEPGFFGFVVLPGGADASGLERWRGSGEPLHL